MEIYELDLLVPGLGFEPNQSQLLLLYGQFTDDFVTNPFTVKGKRVKVVLHKSRVSGYEAYPETFVHLITRKGTKGERIFDKHRANKIHWVKCILNNCHEEEITYFEYPENGGTLRHYYWYKEGDFLVIMEPITPEYLIITSFNIDDARSRGDFEKKETWYKNRK